MRTLIAVLVLAAAPAVALAGDCKTDADCGKDERCVPIPCPSCPAGAECPPCDGGGECVIEAEPADQCQTDADCPSGFSCKSYDAGCGGASVPGGAPDSGGGSSGSGGVPTPCTCACAEGQECPPCECETEPVDPDPETDVPCAAQPIRVCEYSPKECAADADCAAGFECAPVEMCWGTGCACPSCACPPCEPGAECPPCDCEELPPCDCPPPETKCEVLGHYCQVKAVECDDAADCPADWECTDGGCMCPACDCMEGVPDCKCGECSCRKQCMPGGWGDYGVRSPEEAAAATDLAAGGNGGGTGTPKGGEGPAGTGGDGTQAPSAPNPAPAGESASGAGDNAGEKAGCGAGAAGAFPWMLAPLAFLLRRRRVAACR
ncbi:MAG: hypothetical protein FJ087_08705 [Deltaproteobacteria bacterium]|nr:hypothetical protein [Deltaproteobacteria bacterium]